MKLPKSNNNYCFLCLTSGMQTVCDVFLKIIFYLRTDFFIILKLAPVKL